MRLIIPLFFVLIGVCCGALISKLFNQTADIKISAIAGGFGAFAGLLMRDILDNVSGGLIGGAILAALTGALLLSVIANVVIRLLK